MASAPLVVTAATAALLVCGTVQSLTTGFTEYAACGGLSPYPSKLCGLTGDVRSRCEPLTPKPPATCKQGCAWRRSAASCRRNEYVGSYDYAPSGGGRTQCCHNEGVAVDTSACERRSYERGGRNALRRNEVVVSVDVDVADDPSKRPMSTRTRRNGAKVVKRYRVASDKEIALRKRQLAAKRRARRQYKVCSRRRTHSRQSRKKCAAAKRRARVEIGVSASGNIGSMQVDIQVRTGMTVCKTVPVPERCEPDTPPPPITQEPWPEPEPAECDDYDDMPCDDGTCMPLDKYCDGRADCADGSDEAFCADDGDHIYY